MFIASAKIKLCKSFMNKSDNKIKDMVIVGIAWLMALSFLYLVYIKLKILFHSM